MTTRRRRATLAVAMLVGLATLADASFVAAQEPPPSDSSTTTTTTTPAPTTTTTTTTTAPPPTTSTPPTAPPTTASTTPATTATTTTTTAPAELATAASVTPEAPAAEANAAAPPPPGCTVSRILRSSYQGLDVGCVDDTLSALGFAVALDNAYDAATVAAVQAWQGSVGLYPSGILGPASLTQLGLWARPAGTPSVPAPGSFGCTVSRILLSGYQGIDVGCLDNVLLMLGYDLAPNNIYDAATINAIRAYQASMGLGADGSAGPVTLDSMGLWAAPAADAPGPPPGSYGCAVSRILLAGYQGLDVHCLDNVLVMLGYSLTPNPAMDAETMAALRSFQRSHNLSQSGIGGPATLGRMSIWTAPASPWPPVAGSFGCTASRSLGAGMVGLDVRCLDNVLVMLGYSLAPNDAYDESTINAVTSFQRANALPANGTAGSTTLSQMGLWVAPPPPPAPPPNAYGLPANSGTGRRVVYSRAHQRVRAVEATGVVVKTHLVSGRRYEPYAGTYSVYSRSMYTYASANPDIKFRYMVRFSYGPGGGRIGFHEIPTRYGVPLQSNSQLGQPLSGGCVRQSTADAQWMWNWAGIGTKVVVL